MARSVADLRVAFAAMVRHSPADPWYAPVDVDSGPPPQSLTVAVVRDPAGLGVHPEVAAALERAVQALLEAGHRVEEAEPPGVAEAAEGWGRLIAGDIEALRPQIEALAGGGARRFLEIAGAALPAPDLGGLASAFVTRHRLLREWAAFQERYPVLLAPVATSPPFPAGADLDERGAAAFLVALRMVVAINFLGLPAVAVPAGPGGGMPQAVQLIGARFGEARCLQAAEAVELQLGRPVPIEPR
jgi:amidase